MSFFYDSTSRNQYLRNLNYLKGVAIPNSVTIIEDGAFRECSKLESVTIPNSVTTIGKQAFYDCTNLLSLTIGSGVRFIGIGAFSDYYKYSYGSYIYYAYTIPKVIWLRTIPPSGYSEVKASVNYVSNNEFSLSNQKVYPFLSSRFEVGNVVYVPVSQTEGTCDIIDCNYAPGSSEITIPEIVTYNDKTYKINNIGDYALYKSTLTRDLAIPNSVTTIGDYAFSGCTNLCRLTIGSGVKEIGKGSFSYYTIPKVIWLCNTPPNGHDNVKASVNYVSNNEFSLSNQKVYPFLSSRFEVGNVVYVPVSPSERTCDVIDCNYAPSSTEIVIDSIVNNRNIQLKVLNVKPYSFYDNDKITSLKISNSGYIGGSAFYGCGALKTVNVSNNGYIGGSAFYGCMSLKTADLSNKGYVGSSAFYNCSSLKTVTLNINGVIWGSCFENCAKLSLHYS